MPAALKPAAEKTIFPVTIGRAAQYSGVSSKMIRHYEEIGLIRQASRTDSGYRVYSERDVQTLRFVKKAREFGFPTSHITQLLGLWQDSHRASADVKTLARRHIAELDQKIAAMTGMREALDQLLRHCPGNSKPNCPVLEWLGTGGTGARAGPKG